ncbi:MAG: hypothetical protein MJ158_01765, partial [Alphaproteobacteria bacterium]|nr:hypothetical protein [Alphaproteobacteria bacterium]
FITKINGVSYAGVKGDTVIDLTSIDSVILPSAYSMDESGSLVLAKQQQNTNYKNYIALNNALTLTDTNYKSKVDVIANSSVIPTLYSNDTATLYDALGFSDKQSDLQTNFYNLVHNYYDTQTESTENEIANFYKKLSVSNAIAVFSTGRFVDDLPSVKEATFENAAPLIFDGIQNNFVSVVAVGMSGNGTADYVGSDISAYAPSNKITLSAWGQDTDMDGTTEYYKSRICGVAGLGVSDSVNPWCFASAGITDELAVSSAAAAIGVVKSAFGDAPKFIGNENQYVLSLLALTADGPYLATDSDGNAFNVSTDSSTGVETYAVAEYLRNKYLLPNQYRWTTDKEYLTKFKEVYGYGLINLERALTPSKNVYFYNGKYIVSNKGNAYWRSASNTMLNLSGAFNLGQQKIKTSYYDVLSSSDLSFQLPRVWTDEISLGTNNKHGLYMGDVLGEFNVDTKKHTMQKIGKNIEFDMQISERTYNDKYNGLDRLHFGYAENNMNIDFDYQYKFTNGESRFDGRANGILALASNTLSSNFAYKVGQFEFGGSAFSGNITDDNLLENDPTISAQFESARLGFVNGGSMNMGYSNHNLQFNMSAGIMNESDTILGTYTGGLLSLSGGKTQYVDTSLRYSFTDNINMFMRGTFGNTTTDITGGIITNISDLRSNAFAIGLDINNFNITLSEPLAITNGKMGYGYADYIITENSFGNYDLTITNAHTENIDLSVDKREFRLNTSYKYAVTDFTDAGLGLIYRVNPNNTDDFGNETILMFKLHHRLGI